MKKVISLNLAFLILMATTVQSSCERIGLESARTVSDALDRLRVDLVNQSEEWQYLVAETRDQIRDEIHWVVDRLDEIMTEAQRKIMNVTTCTSEFIAHFIVYEIEKIMEELTGKVGTSLVTDKPVGEKVILCHVDNPEINLSAANKTKELIFSIFGYFGLGEAELVLLLKKNNGTPVKLPDAISTLGNNEKRIDLEGAYFTGVLEQYDFVLIADAASNKVLSTIRIKS